MRRRRVEPSFVEVLRGGWRELALYLAAGVVYVSIGVAVPEFLFSWVVAVVFLLICIVVLPALVRRLTR